MDDCNICGNKFTAQVRAKVACPACNEVACKECVKQYLLTTDIVRCMFPACAEKGNRWSRRFYAEILGQSFVDGKLAGHQKEAEFLEEVGNAPYTLEIIEKENKIAAYRKRINDLKSEITEIEGRIGTLLAGGTDVTVDDSDDEAVDGFGAEQRPRKKEVKTRYACPYVADDGEKCRGFIHGRCICSICNNMTCIKCYTILGELPENHKKADIDELKDEHECKPEDIASMDLIKKDCTTCPNCSQGIHKISGCNQVSCSSCATVFDFVTKRVVKDPRYWHAPGAQNNLMAIRGNAGLQEGNNCENDMPVVYQVSFKDPVPAQPVLEDEVRWTADEKRGAREHGASDYINNVIRMYNHLNQVTLPRYERHIGRGPEFNLAARKKYYRNEITKEAFITSIHRAGKQRDSSVEWRELINTIVVTMRDMIWSVYIPGNDQPNWYGGYRTQQRVNFDVKPEFMESLERLRIFFNEESAKIGKCFNYTKYLRINTGWTVSSQGDVKTVVVSIPKAKAPKKVGGKGKQKAVADDDEDLEDLEEVSDTESVSSLTSNVSTKSTSRVTKKKSEPSPARSQPKRAATKKKVVYVEPEDEEPVLSDSEEEELTESMSNLGV